MLNIQKAPILLAIFAWLMQLSVFITPILLKHPEVGNGICEQLAVILPPVHTQMEQNMQHEHSQMPMLHSMSHHEATLKTSHPAHGESKSISMSEHGDNAHCKFCLLLGHQFNPILLGFLLLLLSILLASRTQHVLSEYAFKLHQKLYFYLFQNRAPPAVQFVY